MKIVFHYENCSALFFKSHLHWQSFFAKLLATASKADNTIFALATLGDATRV